MITSFRNHLYNIGYSHSFEFDLPVINVGNLRIGGTGKTPHVEYLIRLLKDQYIVAALSRGYGRRSHGFIMANKDSSAVNIGDEPMQYYRKFNKDISVTVCEDRAMAIPQILFEKEDTQIIILDDAFQHRSVRAGFNILLSDYKSPFYNDLLMPSGRLRESRKGAVRADAIVISKCPANLSDQESREIIRQVKKYSRNDTPIYFSSLKYDKPKGIYNNTLEASVKAEVVMFSGLADSGNLKNYIEANYSLAKNIDYPDHYKYKPSDVKDIIAAFKSINSSDKIILTTEKDMVKLLEPGLNDIFNSYPVFYIPVEVYFLADKQMFDEQVIQSVKLKMNKSNIHRDE